MLVVRLERKSLRSFLMSMRLPDGSFSMHEGGECDIRSVVLSLAQQQMSIHSLMTAKPGHKLPGTAALVWAVL